MWLRLGKSAQEGNCIRALIEFILKNHAIDLMLKRRVFLAFFRLSMVPV